MKTLEGEIQGSRLLDANIDGALLLELYTRDSMGSIDLAIEKSLQAYGGGRVECVQDAEYCGSTGALKMSMEMPAEYWEKI